MKTMYNVKIGFVAFLLLALIAHKGIQEPDVEKIVLPTFITKTMK
jgi:membrane-anchored glycerophosphoryl diester phosphodiesterase (GDPDase)